MSLVNLEDGSCKIEEGTKCKIENCCDSESTSSIGNNSDVTDSGDSSAEVDSPYKGGLDTMDALEEVLPFRRGISRFYNGKSKSFASLARASSIQDLAKTENAYTRRRRNLLASTLIWDKNRFNSSCSSLKSNGGGISKKTLTNMSRSNLALAVAVTATSLEDDNKISTSIYHDSEPDINLVTPTCSSFQKPKPLLSGLSHFHRDMSTWRSFSLADLHSTVTPNSQCSAFGSTSEENQRPF